MGQGVPEKGGAFWAGESPIFSSLEGKGAGVLIEAGVGIACPAEDAQALVDAVIRLRDAPPEELEQMSRRGLRYYEKNFDPKLLATRLVQILFELVHGEHPPKSGDKKSMKTTSHDA